MLIKGCDKMKTSRIPGFYKLSVDERRDLLTKMNSLTEEEKELFYSNATLPVNIADNMIENVVGTFSLPLGLGLNFLVNGKEYTVPMAVEEASIVASASYIAKIVREAGGFEATATDRVMIGQIQVVGCPDFEQAKEEVLQHKDKLIAAANDAYPSIKKRGGGAEDLEVRILNEEPSSKYNQMLILHMYINTVYAMGANMINRKSTRLNSSHVAISYAVFCLKNKQ